MPALHKLYEIALTAVRDRHETVTIGPHILSFLPDPRWGLAGGCGIIHFVPKFDICGSHDVHVGRRMGGFAFTSVSLKRMAKSLAREASPHDEKLP